MCILVEGCTLFACVNREWSVEGERTRGWQLENIRLYSCVWVGIGKRVICFFVAVYTSAATAADRSNQKAILTHTFTARKRKTPAHTSRMFGIRTNTHTHAEWKQQQ